MDTWADGGRGSGQRGKNDTATNATEGLTSLLKRDTSALMAKARKGLKTRKGKLILGGMVIKSAISVGVLYHFYNKATHTPPKATSASPADDHGIDAINDEPGPGPQSPSLPRV